MDICVISDGEPLGSRVRDIMTSAGHVCPQGAMTKLSQAGARLSTTHPELVVAILGSDCDASLETIARLRSLTHSPILAIGPVVDPKTVLRVLRGGAADFVDEADLDTELLDAIARVHVLRDGKRVEPGRLLAVIGPSGGSGSSLVAANLAVALAKLHERSLLLDLKPRCGDLAAMLDLKPTHTIQDLCRMASRIDRVLLEQTLSVHGTGVSLLASGRGFNEAPVTWEGLERIVDLGRSHFPRVVVDVDPAVTPESLGVLKQADEVLIVIRLEFNSLRNAKSLLDHLERQGMDPKRMRLIANRKGQPKEIAAAKVEEALNRTFFATLPDDPKAALGAQNNGVPVLKEYPSSWLSRAIQKLASALDALPARVPSNTGG